jgi:hypothetical protein
MIGGMSHAHHWRATNKIFALVCECGTVYHEWLLAEIDRLKAAGASAAPAVSAEEVAALRAQLAEAQRDREALRAQLDEAQKELATRAEQVTSKIVG